MTQAIRKWVVVALLLLLSLGGWLYYSSAAQVKKREIQRMLADYALTVASQDSKHILGYIDHLLAQDAAVHLSVHFFSVNNQHPALEENFTKAEFLQFVDNILYSTEHYSSRPAFGSVELDTGAVEWSSQDEAIGKNMMGGVALPMTYQLRTVCNGFLTSPTGPIMLCKLDCVLQLRQTIRHAPSLP